jgi:hypothetical protein
MRYCSWIKLTHPPPPTPPPPSPRFQAHIVICSSIFVAAGPEHAHATPDTSCDSPRALERLSAPPPDTDAGDGAMEALVLEMSSVTDIELKRCREGLVCAGAVRSIKGVVLGLQSYTQRHGHSSTAQHDGCQREAATDAALQLVRDPLNLVHC